MEGLPFPEDHYEQIHYNMIRAHETFKTGYDSILSHLDNPPLDDLVNFLGYCEAWAASIESHHDSEEIVVFPFLTQKLDFSRELEQHKVIHAGLDNLLDYIRAAEEDSSKFDPSNLKTMMQKLKGPLYQHLDEEIPDIHPDRLKVFDLESIESMNADLKTYVKSHGDPTVVLTYMCCHTPPEYKDIWPPFPWVLRKVIIPVIGMWHYGYWKYAPYAMS